MAKHDEEMNEDKIDEGDSSGLRVYELGFHIDPELPTEEVKKAYHAMRELIEKNGTLVAEAEPEKIQLAYTISRQETSGRRDFDTAYFCWVVYETNASQHSEVVAVANADKRVIRFIDLITTKDAARHSVEMHDLSMKTSEQSKDSETAINEELDTALENAAV
jgi:ribosomal protein S6